MNSEKSTLKRLKLLPRLFRKTDAEKIAPHTAQFLSRAVAAGLIYRINRGNYVNAFLLGMPEVEEVACFLRPPAYVSCEWALNYHGITLQVPRVCTAITLSGAVGKQRSVEYQGTTIEFSTIAAHLFRGFEILPHFQIATPEKAILDALHLHRGLPASDELEWDAVNRATLMTRAKVYPTVVNRRLQAIFREVPVSRSSMERPKDAKDE
ncbi:MAG: hypothetical protein U5R49_27170 [Deltaproteobacteria bacterium]|nr:hypothetical protein [Deltaproteobacteria bacterium]